MGGTFRAPWMGALTPTTRFHTATTARTLHYQPPAARITTTNCRLAASAQTYTPTTNYLELPLVVVTDAQDAIPQVGWADLMRVRDLGFKFRV